MYDSVVVARAVAITAQRAAQTTNVHSSSSKTRAKTLDVRAKASANILGLIKGVRHGMTTKICLNVSTHLAKLLSANAVADMDTLPATAVFLMMRQASTCVDIIKKREKARHA